MSNLEKERKHIDYLKNQIREGVKPEQASLLLQTIYDFSCLQKFKIDNKEEIIDVEDIAEYQYEQWSSKINNRDDFVFVVYQSLKLYSQIDQGIKRHSLKITDGIKEVLRQIEKLIKDSCYNHLDFYERECPKSKIGKKLKGESEEKEPAKETLEQQGENLLYAYQNQARQELDKIDVVFAGSLYDVDGEEGKEPLKDAKGNLVKNLKGEPIMVDKNQVILYSEFSERIENEKNIEKVKMIVEEALIFSCNITKKLLDKNFFDQSTLYKYLKCLPRNIRNELFFNNFNEWDGYPELIGEKLSKEQIQELFFSKEKVKDELLARLGNEVIPHLQNEVNLFSSQVYSLKRSSELWQKMIADLKSKNGSLKDEKQELIDELAI
ncbi:10341_t:CDS:2 [Funneliformis geosporum]|nr:10341_t:CDS:2 [Funneliformis geosporum]